MKAFRWQRFFTFIIAINLIWLSFAQADITSKKSNIFALDTRITNPDPVDGWQILTNEGNTYNEDFVIDDHGKVWSFYLRSMGPNQPVYMKIFNSQGYVYKNETIVGYASPYEGSEYNSVRAALCQETGDVWVTVQGDGNGYFVRYDSTGSVAQDSTQLATNCHQPKVTQGKDGRMWISWHTDHTEPFESNAQVAAYFNDGTVDIIPRNVGSQNYVMNTDIAVDDSNHIWVVFEVKINDSYTTQYSLFKEDFTMIVDSDTISTNPIPMNTQRQIFSDNINKRVWILSKNDTTDNQKLRVFSLDGSEAGSISNVGECIFHRNETNLLEVIRFNDDNALNKTYETASFNALTGALHSDWNTKFDSTFSFVRNGFSYNTTSENFKIYGVHEEENLTKIKFQQVTAGMAEITVSPTSINFDTTKITAGYFKQRDIKITNIGNALLTVYDINHDSSQFSLSDTSFQVSPGRTFYVTAQFAPTDTNEITDTLKIISNSTVNSEFELTLSGKGYNPGTPDITVNPTSLEFDSILLGNSQIKYLYIYNQDRYERLVINSFASEDSQFVHSTDGFTLGPRSGDYISITFRPKSEGIQTDTLIINNNDPEHPNLAVPLSGTGLQPAEPQISVDSDSLHFGEVAFGYQKSLYLGIENNGQSTLNISKITSSDSQFTANQREFSISAYTKRYILITYHAYRLGEVAATLTINSDDQALPEYIVKLTAIGREENPPEISLSSDSLYFSSIPVGSQSAKYLWISNTGEQTLTIQDITSNDSRFTLNKNSFSVTPGSPQVVAITFAPDEPETFSGTLTIVSNDPENDTSYVKLTGQGRNLTEPELIVNAEELNFGSVGISNSSTLHFTVYNRGEQQLTISDISVSGIDQGNNPYSVYPSSFTLSSHQYRTVYVTFTPNDTINYNASLNIESNDPPDRTVSLVGSGRTLTDPSIYVDRTQISFDETAISKTSSAYLWFSNTGEQELTIENIFHSDTSFSVNIDNFILNPGQSQYVLVSFSPQYLGEYQDTLKIQSNDPENEYTHVFLYGTGRNLFDQNIQVSTDSLDFGAIPVGQRSTYGLVVYNTGEQNLSVSNISNNFSEYSLDVREFTVSPNSNRTVYIAFEPETTLTYSDTLIITSDDPDTPTKLVKVTGSGRELMDQHITIAPDSLYFGSIGVGLQQNLNLQIRNAGEKNLVVDSLHVSNDVFSISGQPSFTLVPGASQWLTVNFAPTSVDTFQAQINVLSNDPDSSNFVVPLTGYGRMLLGPDLTVTPSQLNFEDVAVGLESSAYLTLGNEGEQDLVVTNIISNDAQFVPAPLEITIPPNSSQLVKVTFKPVAIDTFDSKLTFISNDEDSSEFAVPVSGIGRMLSEPRYATNAKSIDFGQVMLGENLTRSVSFSNNGDLPLVLYNVATSDTHFTVPGDSITIDRGQSYAIPVTFTPSDTHLVQANLMLNSNDPNNYAITIPIQGSGKTEEQMIAVSPIGLVFGDVRVNSTMSKSVLVSNFGENVLTIYNILSTDEVYTTNLSDFSLNPNESQAITVYFSPDSVKSYPAYLTLLSNDPVKDSLYVYLSGNGRDSLNASIAIDPDSLDFGRVAVNNSETLSIDIYNAGEKTLQISNVTTTGSAFTPNTTSFSVNAKSQSKLYVTFVPTSVTSYLDSLEIISNDPINDTLLVTLSGNGREQNPQNIAVSDTVLNFGVVPTDRTNSKSLWVYNSGEKNLEISEIVLSDSQFTANEDWFVVAPGQSQYLLITFAPTREDTIGATLTLRNNDPEKPEKVIQLNGQGVFYQGPRITTTISTLNFGNTLIGATKKMNFWVKNLSENDTLRIFDFNTNSENFSVPRREIEIPPMDSSSIQVTYKPVFDGYHSTTLSLYSNDEYQQEYHFWLYGYGVQEQAGVNYMADIGWNGNGYAPFGEVFDPTPNTPDVLSNPSGRERAWFIKDIFLYDQPDTAIMNICFDDRLHLYINGSYALYDTSASPAHWNITNFNAKPYLKLGRNRIAIMVWNQYNLGGFDLECVVDGETKIKRGDQNWTDPDATWWYFGQNGVDNITPDYSYNGGLWFYSEYGLSGIDTVTANWTFEPNMGDTLYDNTPYGQIAVLSNINWLQGVSGYAMGFSGSYDSYVELQTSLNSVPQTIELWFNCYGLRAGNQNIITNIGDGQYGHGMFITENGRLGVYYYGGVYITDYVIDLSTWVFVSTQYTNDRINVYVNNTLVGDYEIIEPGNPVGSPYCYLGGNPLSADTTSFYGAIDELVIKNTANAPTPMPAVATISISEPDTVIKQNELQLSFEINPSPFRLLSGTLEYAKGGSQNFHSIALAESDSMVSPLTVSIPADSVTIRGLKYRINLTTDYGSVYYPTFGQTELGTSWIEVKTEGETADVTLPAKTYKMVSVPFNADSQSVESILEDDLNSYNPYYWRLFEWVRGDTLYTEYGDSLWSSNAGFERGKAYWLISYNETDFDVGAGSSPSEENYRIELTPGWNMIANPFPYPVEWASIEKTSDGIADPVYWSAEDTLRWIYTVENLEPWEGYFLWNGDSSNRSILVPPMESHGIPLKKSSTLADKYRLKYENISVLISAEARCGKYIDIDNLFGISEKANNEYDKFDLKEAPPIGNYVSLYMDNKSWSEQGGGYTVDIKKQDEFGQSWPVTLAYYLEEPPADLQFKMKKITKLPDEWMMYLFDLSEDVAVNMEKANAISVKPVSKKHVQKKYKFVVGTKEFIENNSDGIPLVPLKFELFQNYPNPFNAATTISFNLPKRMKATVKIYNILGQLVKTVVDDAEMRGGHHKLHWNGLNEQGNLVSTGLYLIRLETTKDIAVKKLLLIK